MATPTPTTTPDILAKLVSKEYNKLSTAYSAINNGYASLQQWIDKRPDLQVINFKSAFSNYGQLVPVNELLKMEISELLHDIPVNMSTIDDLKCLIIQAYAILHDVKIWEEIAVGHSDSFMEDIRITLEPLAEVVHSWSENYKELSQIIITLAIEHEQISSIINWILFESTSGDFIVSLIAASGSHFDKRQKNLLIERVEAWKDDILNSSSIGDSAVIPPPQQQVVKNNYTYIESYDANYKSRFGLVPIGPIKDVSDLFGNSTSSTGKLGDTKSLLAAKDIAGMLEKHHKESSFILFYIPQKTIIQYNMLPIISLQYARDNDLLTSANSVITSKILERYQNIKKIIEEKEDMVSNVKKSPPNSPAMIYKVRNGEPDELVHVYEYFGHGKFSQLSTHYLSPTISISEARFIISDGHNDRIAKYNNILETQIVKNVGREHVQGYKVDFHDEVRVSLDIIVERIIKEFTPRMKKLLEVEKTLPRSHYEFVKIIDDNQSRMMDSVLLCSLQYFIIDANFRAESNFSFLVKMKDIIIAFKKELFSQLKRVKIAKEMFRGDKGKLTEFIMISYIKAVTDTVYSLQKSQSLWLNLSKSLKIYILTRRGVSLLQE